jgi:SAM-dependent MidA family methyltransferase
MSALWKAVPQPRDRRTPYCIERSTLNVVFLHPGNPVLIELIRAEIQKRGPVSFAWFMQQALYHPEHGYYSSGQCTIGRRGDYFTNVSVGPLFGQLLAAQFVETWNRLGDTDNFVVVEQGAHHGEFARDVLDAARQRWPGFFAALRYWIIEPFPILQDRQSKVLAEFKGKVEWRASIDALDPFTGVHFSNELLDSMAVHLIGRGKEKLVDLHKGEFVFVENAIEDAQGTTASEPSRGKPAFNQAALDWVENVAGKLRRGYVIAFDYGHLGDEFRGSVQVRARHRHLDSPLEQIGHADITMHVDWTSIAERAQANGLSVAGFTDQHHFLTGIISTWPRVLQETGSLNSTALSRQVQIPDVDSKTKRALQTLLHPELLGRAFQVLALAKNVDPGGLRLAGFKFAREPAAALELE